MHEGPLSRCRVELVRAVQDDLTGVSPFSQSRHLHRFKGHPSMHVSSSLWFEQLA